VRESDLADFFHDKGCKVVSSRVVIDKEGNAKGFGYVTFEDADSLKVAVEQDSQEIFERSVRVDVAAAPHGEHSRENRPRRDSHDSEGHEATAEPAQRKKLELKPRSSDAPASATSAAAGSAKSNPFGQAKPRDELAFQQKKEEERKKREEDAKKKEPEERPNPPDAAAEESKAPTSPASSAPSEKEAPKAWGRGSALKDRKPEEPRKRGEEPFPAKDNTRDTRGVRDSRPSGNSGRGGRRDAPDTRRERPEGRNAPKVEAQKAAEVKVENPFAALNEEEE